MSKSRFMLPGALAVVLTAAPMLLPLTTSVLGPLKLVGLLLFLAVGAFIPVWTIAQARRWVLALVAQLALHAMQGIGMIALFATQAVNYVPDPMEYRCGTATVTLLMFGVLAWVCYAVLVFPVTWFGIWLRRNTLPSDRGQAGS